MKNVYEIEIEAMPKDLPHEIEVDITGLAEFGSHIALKDVKLPHGVVALADPEETIASVVEPKEEKIEEPVEAIDMESIEVEKKGKEEVPEEGEATEEPKAQ